MSENKTEAQEEQKVVDTVVLDDPAEVNKQLPPIKISYKYVIELMKAMFEMLETTIQSEIFINIFVSSTITPYNYFWTSYLSVRKYHVFFLCLK